MAGGIVFKNAYFKIAGVDLSDHDVELSLPESADAPEASAMGDDTRVRLAGGIKDWRLEVELNQDYAAGKVDATMAGKVGTSVAIEVRPDAGAVAATNPKWTGNFIVEEYEPIAGRYGEPLKARIRLVANGTITRATS